MAINVRNKGSKAERTVAKLMEKWTSKKFSRTPSSGGLNWQASNSKGDIVCTSEGHYFPFCIEVKHHAEIDFAQLLIPNKKQVKVLEFWTQCSRDAKKANKIPLLFMRYNGLAKDLFFVGLSNKQALALGINPSQALNILHLGLLIFTSSELIAKYNYKEVKLKAKNILNETKRIK